MAHDAPSAQLHTELRTAVQAALATRRPLLHHLNADTSWFLQIPRPESAVRNGGRFYYNILLDPWFRGTQTDFVGWFSRQWHATPSAVDSIAELEELAREIEILAAGLRLGGGRKSNTTIEHEGGGLKTLIDAVAISHEFSDHCHKETLLEVHPDVPVFATKEAAKLIESWKHFRTITAIGIFGIHGDTDWRGTSTPPLPAWLGISRLLQKRDLGNIHSALLISFNNHYATSQTKRAAIVPTTNNRAHRHQPFEPDEDEEAAEAIIYTPHGIASSDLTIIPQASPPIRTLALLHGLHNVRIGGARAALQINLGVENGLRVQRVLDAKYWVGTHDEIKEGRGLVGWFLRRGDVGYGDGDATVAWGWGRKVGEGIRKSSEVLGGLKGMRWVELGNGESKVLE